MSPFWGGTGVMMEARIIPLLVLTAVMVVLGQIPHQDPWALPSRETGRSLRQIFSHYQVTQIGVLSICFDLDALNLLRKRPWMIQRLRFNSKANYVAWNRDFRRKKDAARNRRRWFTSLLAGDEGNLVALVWDDFSVVILRPRHRRWWRYRDRISSDVVGSGIFGYRSPRRRVFSHWYLFVGICRRSWRVVAIQMVL